MPGASELPWFVGPAGAVVVLLAWVWDLRQQRNYERQRVAFLTDLFAKTTSEGTDSIRELTEAMGDAMDALQAQETGQPVQRRRRSRGLMG